ncbi:MAG: hypothetical protein WDO15_07775 [Bacteroidota bacterium]
MSETTKNEVKLKDEKIRLIGIPFFGIVIPNLTGLFGGLRLDDARYWLGYVLFIGLAATIWQGQPVFVVPYATTLHLVR